MKEKESSQVGEEIEVTTEMIEAGVSELFSWEESDNYSWKNLAKTVYLVMRNLELLVPRKETE